MGIKYLNRLLLERCGDVGSLSIGTYEMKDLDVQDVDVQNEGLDQCSIQKCNLGALSNKTLVVDTSIYMYKYLGQNALLENFYLMISLFRKHQITPVFIFDGKPPPEKHTCLKERMRIKKCAKEEYAALCQEWGETETKHAGCLVETRIDQLKKQFMRIRDCDIKQVKQLMRAYGISYYDAPGEADQMCVSMVLSGKAWACVSDDMDMFVYGCSRIIRHVSLLQSTALIYQMKHILIDLNMSMETFRQIAVLSGTDYNTKQPISLYKTLQLYEEYILSIKTFSTLHVSFYEWVAEKSGFHVDIKELVSIYNMFCLDDATVHEMSNVLINAQTETNKEDLRQLLEADGFVFVEK